MSFPVDLPATRANLEHEFRAAGLPLSPEEADKFWQLHLLLEKRNPEGDLTRVHGFYNLLYKHYIDGAMAAEFIQPVGLTMDLGTGAGFPGLPLAIRRPHWPLLLAEPRGRRLAFMEEAVALLGLSRVEFYPHKVGPRFDRVIANFITRDFEPAPASLARAAEIIPPGGRVYLMKGPAVDAELRAARALPEWAEFELEDDRAYTLGPGGLKRRLITWRKKDNGRPAVGRLLSLFPDEQLWPDRPSAAHLFATPCDKLRLPDRVKTPIRGAAKVAPYRVVEIASRENPRYKSWLKSLSGKGLKKSGQALVAGRKFVAEILAAHPDKVAGLIARRLDDLEGLPIPDNLTVHLARPELLPDLDLFGTGPPLLILDISEPPAWDGRLAEGLTVFLPFQDPANLGAAIRTSAALGARIVLTAEAASPWHPKSLRASGPALLASDLYQGPPLAELARLDLPGLLALSPVGDDLLKLDFPAAAGLVFGIEGPGLDEIWPRARRFSIPMAPGVESLNAAAALAVTLGLWLGRR